ncbi:MAG: sensor histidine kinase, partial [Acidimicrobiales bacterium]
LDDLPVLVSAARMAGADVTAELHGESSAVPAVVSREVYRILQECLTNVVRHAGRVPVTMTVAVAAGGLRATVTNPLGEARAQRPGGGRGLRGMAERAELLGGTFGAGPVGLCWEVVVTVPWGSR